MTLLPAEPIDARAIADYYDQTDETYQHWGNAGAYELHYGYHDLEASEPASESAQSAEPTERQREKAHARALVRMNRAVADAVGVTARDHVLDAGCGVGGSSLWLAEHRGCRVHGISLSAVQVEKARNFASALNTRPERLEFSVRDFTSTGFAAASFDVVWALESFCHAESTRRFLTEAYCLLRPGGRLVIADYLMPHEPQSDIERYCLDRWLRGWAIPGLPTVESIQRELHDAGFKENKTLDITERIRPSAEEIYRRGREGYPADILKKGKNVLQIQHVEACLFQKICLDQGLWRYHLQTARKT